jgi:uncharacterized membrane protein
MDINKILSVADQQLITDAIAKAELKTSGEIRVHLELECKEDVMDHAAYIFNKLGMNKTKERNAVLFYLAIQSHHFAVIGDAGIHAKVGDDFWEKVKNECILLFKQEKWAEGLSAGILECGNQLKTHFPFHKDDTNELSNDISFNTSAS